MNKNFFAAALLAALALATSVTAADKPEKMVSVESLMSPQVINERFKSTYYSGWRVRVPLSISDSRSLTIFDLEQACIRKTKNYFRQLPKKIPLSEKVPLARLSGEFFGACMHDSMMGDRRLENIWYVVFDLVEKNTVVNFVVNTPSDLRLAESKPK